MIRASLDHVARLGFAPGRRRAILTFARQFWPEVSWGLLALLLLGPSTAEGQEYRFGQADDPGVEIGRNGTSIVIETAGPPLFGRREIYRPVPPLRLRNRWIVVQDSTFGVVFAEPSGVKPDLQSYDADVYLRSLEGVNAVEIRALVFNLWGELSGYLGVTVLMEREAGDTWDLHPRWSEVPPTDEHRTSIMWINRVMFDDESILTADVSAVATAWSYVTGTDFDGLPEESLRRVAGR